MREGIATLGDDGACVGPDQAGERHAARGRGASVVNLVIGHGDRGQRLRRDCEVTVGQCDAVVAEQRAAAGDGDQAVRIGADVRASPASAGGDGIRTLQASNRRRGIGLGRGRIDAAGGRADDGQRSRSDIGGDTPDTVRGVVRRAEAREADAREVHGLARADVGVGEGARDVGADHDIDRGDVSGQDTRDLHTGRTQRSGGGGVVDLILSGDTRGGKRPRGDGARGGIDGERVIRAAVAVAEDVAVRDRERRSPGAEHVAVGEGLREARERIATEQARDGRGLGRSRGAVVDLGISQGVHGERRRRDGRGRGHAGRPTEGVVGQRGRVALDGDASEGHRLAAGDILAVEGGRGRRGGERIAAEQAEYVDAARGRGTGVVDLVVGRADDAGADAAVRAEEELERRDRQCAVRLCDGVIAEGSAGSRGDGEGIRVGADVAAGAITGKGHGLAADQAGDGRRRIVLGRSVIDERCVRAGDRQRSRGDRRGGGHRGRAAEGVVRQGGRVAGQSDAGQGNGLAASDVLGVKDRRARCGGERVAAEQAEHADAARGRGGGVVDLIIGRADDAGADAAVRAEEELERRDRKRAVAGREDVVGRRGTGNR